MVNDGTQNFKDKTIKLDADIDLDGQEWTTIGTTGSSSFQGCFDGDGHTITNLKINNSSYDYAGIFGYISGSTIENLHVVIAEEGIIATGYNAYVGGIAGYSQNSIIRMCDVTGGPVTGKTNSFSGTYVGGIAGFNVSGSISKCFATCNIVAQESYQPLAGGITSANYGTGTSVSDCYYYGEVTSLDGLNGSAGGIVGNNTGGSISNCHSQARVTAPDIAGGIAAKNESGGSVQNCFTKTIESRAVTSESIINGKYAEGIVGYNYSTITNCYSLVEVTGVFAGGIAGLSISGRSTASISYCYATGKVTTINGYSGGIVGYNYSNTNIISHCLALNVNGLGDEEATKGRIAAYNASDQLTSNYASPLIEGEWNDTTSDGKDGEDLTSTNFNNDMGNALADWDADIWDNLDNEMLPVFKGLGTVQPVIPRAPYLQYTIKYDPPANGIISVKYTDGTGVEQEVPSGSNIFGLMNLVITATPLDATTHELETLTVNGNPFNSGDTYIVNGDVEIIASFKDKPKPKPDPTPTPTPDPSPSPSVFHIISLPAVEGATTDPVAGDYEIEAWSSFRFYLTVDKEYDQSVPVVTTSRGETILPRSSDDVYIIKYVRSDVDIFLNGIVKNPDPVANEVVKPEAIRVWTSEHQLHICLPQPEQVYIYTMDGRLTRTFRTTDGNMTVQLPSGGYLVVVKDKRFKVVL